MDNLKKVYEINDRIRNLREDLLHLMYNDSQRSLDLDTKVLKQILKLRKKYDELTHERTEEIKHAYSLVNITIRTNSIPILIIPGRLKIAGMNRGETSIELSMTPTWFTHNDKDEKKILRSIKYPLNTNKDDQRQFNTIACFRAVNKEKSNDFTTQEIDVKEKATETLVLALDAFVQ
jgi:uncharacterized protein (UPF0335 family)